MFSRIWGEGQKHALISGMLVFMAMDFIEFFIQDAHTFRDGIAILIAINVFIPVCILLGLLFAYNYESLIRHEYIQQRLLWQGQFRYQRLARRLLRIPSSVQKSLLPRNPEIHGYEIAAFCNTAEEVGGDFFDVVQGKRDSYVLIADVSGKGLTAGLIMMMLQTAFRMAVLQNGYKVLNFTAAKILKRMNLVMSENIANLERGAKYITCMLLRVSPGGKIEYSGLHQEILLFRRHSGKVEVLPTGGSWLGLRALSDTFGTAKLRMRKSDVLLLHTDGLIEATTNNGIIYDQSRLIEDLANYGERSAMEILNLISSKIERFHFQDDHSLIVLKRSK